MQHLQRILYPPRVYYLSTNTLDISVFILSGYETGEKTPSIEKLLKLAALYQVSTDYLLGVAKTKNPKTLDASHLTDEQFKAIKQLLSIM